MENAISRSEVAQQPDHYFLQMVECEGGDFLPGHVHPTRAKAFKPYSIGDWTHKVKRRPFIPLDTPTRFRLVQCDWLPGLPSRLGMTDEKTHWREREEFFAAFDRADSRNMPASLVDHHCGQVYQELYHQDEELVTREAGLRYVAEYNLEELQKWNDGDRRTFLDWWMLIELGKIETLPHTEITIEDGLVGVEERTIQYPVRLVNATPAEREQYPMPYDDLMPREEGDA